MDTVGTQRGKETENDDADDEEYIPGKTNSKSKSKSKPSLLLSETGRAGLHTLDEHHEHFLLSTSFDANASFTGVDFSSSQIDPGMRYGSYALDDNIFGAGNDLDIGMDMGMGMDIGDVLARELGEGWGADLQGAAAGFVAFCLF